MEKEDEIKKLVVSDLFIEIYENFNVYNQIDKMNLLTDRELYLLIALCLDKHAPDPKISEISNVVQYNFGYSEIKENTSVNVVNIREKVSEIYNLQDDKEVTNPIIKKLIKESDHKYIETKNIIDKNGNKIRDPFTIDEIRDIKINLIDDKLNLI
jgi:hypothetical protein